MYDDIKKIFSELVAIDSPSLEEREMADHIKILFGKLQVEFTEDESQSHTHSNAGNLHAVLSGVGNEPPILFSAHMDTVLPAHGKRAVMKEDGTVTSDGTTVLGADDLSGVTAIYEAVKYLKENQIPHRDIEILFSTGEELYCKGAKAFDYSTVRARQAYVLDLSGRIGNAAFAAPTILSFSAQIEGKAAHAGFCPENGINAIAAAVCAVSRLPQGRMDEETTANIGQIEGGKGVNIVAPSCTVRGEIRSLRHEKAVELLRRYRAEFQKAADAFGAGLNWEENVDVRAYETDLESKTVSDYQAAAAQAGVEAHFQKTFGGSDNNVFAQYGIEGIVIATSMNQVHSCEEYANIHEIAKVAEILVHLAERKC